MYKRQGGGTLGGSSDAIQIIVKNGSEFTAPASDGLNRPAGDTGSYFMWLGSNGKLYAPGAIVPADVTKLTAQFALSEQFSLKPGGTYYFDLSAMGIPGTVNDALPDSTLHYVPFTYVGTVSYTHLDVYKRQIPVWSICFSARPAKPTRRSSRKPLSGIC